MISRLEPPRAHRRPGQAALSAGLGLAAFLAASLALSPAQAQYGWRDDFYGPPEPYYRGYPDYPTYPDRAAPPGMSLAEVRQKVAERGLRLIATPRRKGRIYLAETEDAHGIRHRLVFDAIVGRLIENTVLGPKTPLHPPAPQRPDEANKTDSPKDNNLGDRPEPIGQQ